MKEAMMSMKRFSAHRSRLMGSTASVLVGAAIGFVPALAHAGDEAAASGLEQLAISQAQTAQAQTGPLQQQAGDVQELEQIVVTGSRISRTGFDASTPVTVVDSVDIKLSGAVNVENLLNTLPQFIPSGGGTSRSNNPGSGQALLDLRGFGSSRNLVLVNGRRFAISGPGQVTDINTIPSSLIERTEIVTGGSSAVYGSDAITGVINFVMRDDFEGVEARQTTTFDSRTVTPTYDFNLTMGGNFAEGRGNAVISVNYLKRKSILQATRAFSKFDLNDACVTPESFSERAAGVPIGVPNNSTCAEEGGVPGLAAGGSGSIPNGRFTGLPRPSTLDADDPLRVALEAAGLGSLGARGFTFDDSGANVRPALTPQDDFNFAPDNFLQVPQERWMINTFSHYDFHEKITGYMEFHFSNNRVDRELAATPITGNFLFDVDNPFLSPAMQEALNQLDLRETGPRTITTGSSSRTTTPGDGLAVLSINRRLNEVGPRRQLDERNVWRGAFGFRGELGDVSDDFLRNLEYDVYYSFARTTNTSRQEGNVSRSQFQSALLSQNGQIPLANMFGQNLSGAAVTSFDIGATNITVAEQQVASGTLSGEAFDMPALFGDAPGAVGFSFGGEWRDASARFIPDEFLSSGDVAGFNASQPTRGSETVREFFGEVRVPLLAGLPGIENLTANGAFRWSDYDLPGVGSVWTYLGGADWRVNRDIAFRGQFQRAVRAPNVGELFGGQGQNFPAATDPCAQAAAAADPVVRNLCIQSGVPAALVGNSAVQPNTQIESLTGGNPDLSQESSDTYTLGAVFTPRWVPGLSISIDYFDIKLTDAIAGLAGGTNNVLNLCFNVIQDINSVVCQAIDRNPLNGAIENPFFVRTLQDNIGKIKTEGVDFETRYSFDLDWGFPGLSEASTVNISSNWTWTDKFTVTPVQDLPDQKNFCVASFGNTCGEPIPEFKGTTRVTWNTGPLALSLRHRFVDAVKQDGVLLPKRSGLPFPEPSTITRPRFKPQHYLDVTFTYDFLENFQFTGGVNNVTDNKPPVSGSIDSQANTFPATFDSLGPEIFFTGIIRF